MSPGLRPAFSITQMSLCPSRPTSFVLDSGRLKAAADIFRLKSHMRGSQSRQAYFHGFILLLWSFLKR